MNIPDIYVSIFVYLWKLGYEGLHLSYIKHEIFSNLYEFMIYVSIEYAMRPVK